MQIQTGEYTDNPGAVSFWEVSSQRDVADTSHCATDDAPLPNAVAPFFSGGSSIQRVDTVYSAPMQSKYVSPTHTTSNVPPQFVEDSQ